ncbi:hypothetical protein Tco_0939499 [Tanacetum coccineum]|uniref:DUF8039 domain-containing protein n=1 Tax=Tanacetum coccineum TaxID=301880 RepID=A0ABQ5DKZ2_9ASTR
MCGVSPKHVIKKEGDSLVSFKALSVQNSTLPAMVQILSGFATSDAFKCRSFLNSVFELLFQNWATSRDLKVWNHAELCALTYVTNIISASGKFILWADVDLYKQFVLQKSYVKFLVSVIGHEFPYPASAGLAIKDLHINIREADLLKTSADEEEMKNNLIRRMVFELLSKASSSASPHPSLGQRELYFTFFRKLEKFLESSDRSGYVDGVNFETTTLKTDRKQMLHNKELPKDCYKVSVDKSLVDATCIPDVGNNGFKIVKDAVGGVFAWPKDQVVLDPKDKPPKDGDGAWHAKIRIIDPDGEEFTKTLQSIPTTRKLFERESPWEIINLDHFYDT